MSDTSKKRPSRFVQKAGRYSPVKRKPHFRLTGNRNVIFTSGWSNPDSAALYIHEWPGEPKTAEQYNSGRACLSCLHFAAFNADWGLCCNQESRHITETVFEHFTCPWFRDQRLHEDQDIAQT